ncbi:19769_t:CDS:2, partial [Gigaspora rosea]
RGGKKIEPESPTPNAKIDTETCQRNSGWDNKNNTHTKRKKSKKQDSMPIPK